MTGPLTPGQARIRHRKAFDEFYRAYPRKVSPTEAERAFTDLCEREGDTNFPAMLIAKAKAYALTVDPSDLKYVPAPHSWLRQGRYDDQDLFTNKREQELQWLRDCYRRADVKAVENRFQVAFPKQYPPDDMTDPAAIKLWFKATAQQWITQIAIDKLGAKGE